MDDCQGDVTLPQGSEDLPQREPIADENNTVGREVESPPSATHTTNPTGSRHTATSERTDHNQGPDVHNREGPRRKRKTDGPRRPPLKTFWEPEVVPLLEQGLAASITPPGILDQLWNRHPEAFDGTDRKSMLRSLERHVNRWRQDRGRGLRKRWKPCPRSQTSGHRGRSRRVTFLQEHPPGREVQVDFTHCEQLAVTVQGEIFPHQLFNFRMSHSGWTYSEVFGGETVSA